MGHDGGDLVAINASHDSTFRYLFQSPFTDALSFSWGGGLWSVDSTHNSLITTGNGGNKPARVKAALRHALGTFELPDRTLQPGESLWLNVRELIQNQVLDRAGNAIPPTVTSGVYEFDQLDDDVVGSLYEGKLILDSTYGNAAYGCANCCGYYAMGIVPDPFGIGVGFTGQDMILVENACTGIQSYRTTLGYGWGTGNSGIAIVNNSGLVSALASGQTSSFSSINLSTPEVWHCPVATQRVSNVVTGKTVSVSLSPSSISPLGQSTVTVTLSPAASGHSVSLQVAEVGNSGGHQHLGRPVGTLAASSGTTNVGGQFTTSYTASAFGGGETVTATVDGIAGSKTATVSVSGLSVLGGGTNYNLVGATSTHPSNHYGTSTSNSNLVSIANQYAAQYPGSKLDYNDQSLVQGGLFDIDAGWITPHVEHRFGLNADVKKSSVPSSRWTRLQEIFADTGSPDYLDEVELNHWHLRF